MLFALYTATSGGCLVALMVSAVGQNAMEVWMFPVNEKWEKALRFPSSYPESLQMVRYHFSSFMHTAMFSRDHGARVIVFNNLVLQLRNMW